jgi:Phosphotransferase enzyme family
MEHENRTCVTTHTACAALRKAGLDLSPAQPRIEAREDRWLVWLPGERLAWFPANAKGRELLERERRVLRLLAERCSFQVPRVLFESVQGWDVRAAVPGVCDPRGLYRRTLTDVPLARRLGALIGAILVEQHTRVAHADVAGWLPTRPAWPEPSDRIRQGLPEVIDDRGLLADIDRVLDAYDAVTVADDDRILVHGDLGLHNVAVDPVTAEVRGVFDYDEASWSDRHHDFRYLIFHHEHDEALEAALAVYEPALGRTLSRPRIRLYNAACAISFLAFRRGVPPGERSCGRTLAEDLQWVRGALARL